MGITAANDRKYRDLAENQKLRLLLVGILGVVGKKEIF